MKKYKIAALVLVSFFLIINTSTCKRNNSAGGPDNPGPTGHSITLSGSANPLTLYLPDVIKATITVLAQNYDATPAVNKEIVLESGSYGYFEGNRDSVKLVTNTSGIVNIKYTVPRWTDVRVNTTIYIKATLVDEQASGDADVYCHVPVSIIPYQQEDYIRIKGQIKDADTYQGVRGTVVELSTGEVDVTKSDGSYSLIILGAATQGWYGTITPGKEGYTFSPESVEIGSESAPVYGDLLGQNFYGVQTQSIMADFTTMNYGIGGTGSDYAEVYVFSSPDPKFKIKFNADTGNVGWVKVALSQGGTTYSHVSSTTPKYIYIWVASNAGNENARQTTLVIVATDPQNISGSPLGIAINQEADTSTPGSK